MAGQGFCTCDKHICDFCMSGETDQSAQVRSTGITEKEPSLTRLQCPCIELCALTASEIDRRPELVSQSFADTAHPMAHETHRLGYFLRTKKIFELFERLWGGCFAANVVLKCSTQLFLRVWFFRFSLQPPKCPENVFSKCGGFFFERTFECSNEDIF